jgi:predicted DNA-binding WGR domain protein
LVTDWDDKFYVYRQSRRGFLLMKQWGRIGSFGQIKAERFEYEAPALLALQKQTERKARRGYVAQELNARY